ncbi:hypothetical protein VNI00_016035 [Paramarasmius palmivorus]|uniref:Uncharacterized protein n=1 Tax=Paramarasmius palmivorus TaxID=297713 RepID=A0AAW0BGT1_9AGAR
MHVLCAVSASNKGINLVSGNGTVHCGHPVYGAFVGDYPKQLLVSALKNNECPVGVIAKDTLGDLDAGCVPHDLPSVLSALKSVDQGYSTFYESCHTVGLKPIQNIFWRNLQHTNIFLSITPDILHQLLQGVVKHVISWLKQLFGPQEIDARCRRLPPNHQIHLFLGGISHLSRITGTEHAQICQFILGIIIDIPLPNGQSSQ